MQENNEYSMFHAMRKIYGRMKFFQNSVCGEDSEEIRIIAQKCDFELSFAFRYYYPGGRSLEEQMWYGDIKVRRFKLNTLTSLPKDLYQFLEAYYCLDQSYRWVNPISKMCILHSYVQVRIDCFEAQESDSDDDCPISYLFHEELNDGLDEDDDLDCRWFGEGSIISSDDQITDESFYSDAHIFVFRDAED